MFFGQLSPSFSGHLFPLPWKWKSPVGEPLPLPVHDLSSYRFMWLQASSPAWNRNIEGLKPAQLREMKQAKMILASQNCRLSSKPLRKLHMWHKVTSNYWITPIAMTTKSGNTDSCEFEMWRAVRDASKQSVKAISRHQISKLVTSLASRGDSWSGSTWALQDEPLLSNP